MLMPLSLTNPLVSSPNELLLLHNTETENLPHTFDNSKICMHVLINKYTINSSQSTANVVGGIMP